MFTGIIEEIGIVKSINKADAGALLSVKAEKVIADTKIGDSISVNGSCLSAIEISGNVVSFDIMPETLKKTTLGSLRSNDPVNLERSAKIDARIGGHFVTGHVDYKARINSIIKNRAGMGFSVFLPEEFSKFVVEKGSVALDGASLTVA
jgi:riboflavin synthase